MDLHSEEIYIYIDLELMKGVTTGAHSAIPLL